MITTPAQAAMEGHGLTGAVLIIGSDAELYPHLRGQGLTSRAVAYSVYCPATKRYSVVTLDGRWVIPGAEGYKSRGAVTTYVRKNGSVLRPEGLVILDPVRHNGPREATQFGRRPGTCRLALGFSTRGMYGYDCSCGATVQPDKVQRIGWVIVRDGRGSHTVSYALDPSHEREFGTVPTEIPETANVVVAGAPAPVEPEEPEECTAPEPDEPETTSEHVTVTVPDTADHADPVTLKWGNGHKRWTVVSSWRGMSFWVALRGHQWFIIRASRAKHPTDYADSQKWPKREQIRHTDRRPIRTRAEVEALMIAHVRARQALEAETLRQITEAGTRNAPVWESTLDKGPHKARRMSPEKVLAEWGDAVTFEVIDEKDAPRMSERKPTPELAPEVPECDETMRVAVAVPQEIAGVNKLKGLCTCGGGHWVQTVDEPWVGRRRAAADQILSGWGYERVGEWKSHRVPVRRLGQTEPQETRELGSADHAAPAEAPVAPGVSWHDAVRGEPITIETPKGTVEVRYAGFESVCLWDCLHYEDECPCLPRPVMLCDGEGEPYPWEDCPECMAKKLDVSPTAVRAALPVTGEAGQSDVSVSTSPTPTVLERLATVRLSDGRLGRVADIDGETAKVCITSGFEIDAVPVPIADLERVDDVPRLYLPSDRIYVDGAEYTVSRADAVRVEVCARGKDGERLTWPVGEVTLEADMPPVESEQIADTWCRITYDGRVFLSARLPDSLARGRLATLCNLIVDESGEMVGRSFGCPIDSCIRWYAAHPGVPAPTARRWLDLKGPGTPLPPMTEAERAYMAAGPQEKPKKTATATEGKTGMPAPKVKDISISGEKGGERAEVLGHAYWVSMLAGTYFVKHLGSGVGIVAGEKSRPAMKRAILADAVQRGQAPQGVVARVTPSAEVVETAPDQPVSEYGWERYGQRFAVGDVVRSGHPRQAERTGVVVSVRERGDGEQMAGVHWDGRPVTYEQWSGTLASVPVTVVERAENPRPLAGPAPKPDDMDVVDAELIDEDQPEQVDPWAPFSVGDLVRVDGVKGEWQLSARAGAPGVWEVERAASDGGQERDFKVSAMSHVPDAPKHRLGDLAVQGFYSACREGVGTIRRVYRQGSWVADVVCTNRDGEEVVWTDYVNRIARVTREQVEATRPTERLSDAGHHGAVTQALVTRHAGQFYVWCRCLPNHEVCRMGRKITWCDTYEEALELWAWHVAEVGPLSDMGADVGQSKPKTVEEEREQEWEQRRDAVLAAVVEAEKAEFARTGRVPAFYSSAEEWWGEDDDRAEQPDQVNGDASADPVLVFIASKNTRPARMRVLWKVTRAEAITICSDDRSAGRNHMLCWTADPGAEGEDWEWVKDSGSYDALLAELGVVPERTWGSAVAKPPAVPVSEGGLTCPPGLHVVPLPSTRYRDWWGVECGRCAGGMRMGLPGEWDDKADAIRAALGHYEDKHRPADDLLTEEEAAQAAALAFSAAQLDVLSYAGQGWLSENVTGFYTPEQRDSWKPKTFAAKRVITLYRAGFLKVLRRGDELRRQIRLADKGEAAYRLWDRARRQDLVEIAQGDNTFGVTAAQVRSYRTLKQQAADRKEIPAGVPAGCDEVPDSSPADTDTREDDQDGEALRYHQGGCDGETKWLYVQAEGVARMLRHFLACDCGGTKLGNFGRSAPAMDSGTLRKPKGIRQADIQGADALADRNSYDRTGPFVVLDEVTKRAPVEWRHAKQEIRVVVDPNSAAQPRALERERADTEPAQAPDPARVERLAKEIRIRQSYRIGDEQKRAAYKLAGERIREARRRSRQPEPGAPAVAEGESIKPMNPGWAQEWWLFADVYGYRYEVSHRSGRWHGMARFDESQGEGGVTLPGNLVPVVKSGCATAEELLELCREIGRKRARQDAGSRMLERLTGQASASTTPQGSAPADTVPEARSTFARLLERHHGKDWRPLCTGYAGSEGGELEDVDQDETESQEPPQGIASISRRQRSAAWRIAAGDSQPRRKPEPAAGSAPQKFQVADTAQEEHTVQVLTKNTVGRRLRQARPAREKLVDARRKAARFVREALPPAAARVRVTGQEIAKAVQARIHKPARPTASLHIPAEPTTPVMRPAPVPVPVEEALCDAHIARDGSQVEATEALTLGERSWDLCPEHAERFGNLLEEKAQPLTIGNRAWKVWSDHAEQFAGLLVEVLGEPGKRAAEDAPDADAQPGQEHDAVNDEPGEKTFEAEPAGPEQPSVMLTGEVPGYSWDDARQALRNAGYRVAGRADDTTVLIICGEGAEKNATKLRDAREYRLPCMDVRAQGRFRDAVRAGEFVGGDPLPESAKAVSSGMSEREKNDRIREWGRNQGYELKDRGRLPLHVRKAYELAHQSEAVAA